jgi:hypothetical protein
MLIGFALTLGSAATALFMIRGDPKSSVTKAKELRALEHKRTEPP